MANKTQNGGPGRVQNATTASDMRSRQVLEQIARDSAATDAKTARLKALRLEREAEEAVARAAAPPKPRKPSKRSVQSS